MGRKIPFDTALKIAGVKRNKSIYIADNKYGYKININHPEICPLYERFKEKMKTPILSDKQRFYFESLIFQMIKRGNLHE